MTTSLFAMPLGQLAAVAGGAAIGALLRCGVGLWLNPTWAGFPLGTLAVNSAGGLAIGAAAVWFEHSPNELVRLALVTGLLGGLTTFSAFSVESMTLLQRAEWALAALHTLAHVAGALACAFIGYRLARLLWGG